MSTRTLLPAGLTVLCIGALGGIFAQRSQLNELRAEQQRLTDAAAVSENPPADGLATGGSHDATPKTQSSEVLQLRSQISRLTERKRELSGVRAQNISLQAQIADRGTNTFGGIPLPPGYIRKTQAQWSGMTTPENTLRSFLWAVNNRDFERLQLVVGPRTREMLASMGQDKLFDELKGLPGVRIVSQRQLSDNGDLIEAELEMVPGLDKTQFVQFRLIDGQWRIEMH